MKVISMRLLGRDHPEGEMVMVTIGKDIAGTFVPIAVASPESLSWALEGKPSPTLEEGIAALVALPAALEASPPTTTLKPFVAIDAVADAVAPKPATNDELVAAAKAKRTAQAAVLSRMNGK